MTTFGQRLSRKVERPFVKVSCVETLQKFQLTNRRELNWTAT